MLRVYGYLLIGILLLLLIPGCSGEQGDEISNAKESTPGTETSNTDDSHADAGGDAGQPLAPDAETAIQAAIQYAAENNIPTDNLLHISSLNLNKEQHLLGIDVSHHQDVVNWQASKAAGMRRGAYHMFRPEDTAIEQLENFLNTVRQAGLDEMMLPPVLDVEQVHTMADVNHAVMHERIVEWMIGIEKELGVTPIVYTNPKFWEDYLSDDKRLLDYPLWISEYDMDASEPATTGAWTSYLLWQFSRYGIVPGVSKPVDLNRANKTQFNW